jgi:hypothetical protein
MAKRGTSKWYSLQQEAHVARQYGGVQSKSSGAAAHDYGDVRTATKLIECKFTMKPPKKLLDDFEKNAREAYAEGLEPLLVLRWHAPDSFLADREGYVDLSVRLTCNDVDQEDANEDR